MDVARREEGPEAPPPRVNNIHACVAILMTTGRGDTVANQIAGASMVNYDSAAFTMKRLAANREAVAPDGSDVRLLASVAAGSMAHFQLAPGKTSRAVAHRTVEEIWFFVGGRGEMWRRQGTREEVIPVEQGISLTIPLGTHFQFRAAGTEPLRAIGVTMPPWPGDREAYEVLGPWEPHLNE